MGKLLKYIAKETQGTCFTSFKYCYDTINTPTIKYGEAENEYTNLKEYAEESAETSSTVSLRQRHEKSTCDFSASASIIKADSGRSAFRGPNRA